MLELLELLEPCLAGKHDLAKILEVGRSCESTVARWCRRCGSAVVDVDYDGRTNAGQVMRMRLSEFLKQAIAAIHRYLLHELLVTLRADRAHRLFGKGHDSEAALKQKAMGREPIPQELAAKVRFLAAVVRHLEGGYSNDGVCAWFERPRTQLGGRSPADVLSGAWKPSDPDAQSVLELARSLSSSPAT